MNAAQLMEVMKSHHLFSNIPLVSKHQFLATYKKLNYHNFWLNRKVVALPGAIWHGAIVPIFLFTLKVSIIIINTFEFLLKTLGNMLIYLLTTGISHKAIFKDIFEFGVNTYHVLEESTLDNLYCLLWILREFHMAGGYLYTLWDDVAGLQYVQRAYLENFCYSLDKRRVVLKYELLKIVKRDSPDQYKEMIIELANHKPLRDLDKNFFSQLEILIKDTKNQLVVLETPQDTFEFYKNIAEKLHRPEDQDYIYQCLIKSLKKFEFPIQECIFQHRIQSLKKSEYNLEDHKKYFEIYIKVISHRIDHLHQCTNRLCRYNGYEGFDRCGSGQRMDNWLNLIEIVEKYASICNQLGLDSTDPIGLDSTDPNYVFERTVKILSTPFEKLDDKEKNSMIDFMRKPLDDHHKDERIAYAEVERIKKVNRGVLRKIFSTCAEYFLKKKEDEVMNTLLILKRLKNQRNLQLPTNMVVKILSYVVTDSKDESQGDPKELVSGIKNFFKIPL